MNFINGKIMDKVFMTVLISILSVCAVAQDVAQWRGPNRNGIYNESGLLKKWPDSGPQLLWHYDELGEGHASASVTSSGIYTTGMLNNKGFVFKLDNRGTLLWKKEYGTEWSKDWNGVRSTPLVIQDKLYILSAFGKLVCMNSANGQMIWTVDLMTAYDGQNIQWGITENLLYDGNTLFVTPGGTDANMLALDRNTGKLIWKSKGNGEKSGYCSPLLISQGKRKIIVTMMASSIQGIDASTGAFLWKFPHPNEWSVHPNTPIFIDGYLYCTSGYGQGGVMLKLAPDGNSVSEVWRHKKLDPKIGGVVVIKGRIYGTGDNNRKFFCLDWKTGNEIFAVNSLVPGNVISAEGLIYVYTEGGKVALVQPENDKLNILSTFTVPYGASYHWSHLVISNKKLFVRHGSSLMVYDIAAK
jgi:outer membrane protein assembly factor BamB